MGIKVKEYLKHICFSTAEISLTKKSKPDDTTLDDNAIVCGKDIFWLLSSLFTKLFKD